MTTDTQILIADDDPLYRRYLESCVTKWGFSVCAARNGEDTCRHLLEDEHPKLAIVDWNMPKLDGIGVCEAVRERHSMSDVFILMLTARRDSRDLAAALQAGANDYMTKPFDRTELKARLTTGLRVVKAANLSPIEADRTPRLNEDVFLEQRGYITPVFDPATLRFNCGMPATHLRAWESDGTLQKVLVDRVQVCPQCRCLPSFRFGCSSCGSGCVTNDRLIHHYACAHVGLADEFDQNGDVVCPKCKVQHLVVGADFEHLTGPYRCLDCDWSAAELEHVAHCLGCGFRFPANQAVIEDLVGYHARRLDSLGAITATS